MTAVTHGLQKSLRRQWREGLIRTALMVCAALSIATCCILPLLLSVPYLNSVLLLPVSVFYRNYSVEFLAQFDGFDVRPVEVFEAGVQDHDASLALVHLEDAAGLVSLGQQVSGVRFVASDVMAAPAVSREIVESVGGDIHQTRA